MHAYKYVGAHTLRRLACPTLLGAPQQALTPTHMQAYDLPRACCASRAQIGMPYAFWSAAAVNEEHSALRVEANEIGIDWRDLAEQRRGQDRLKRLSAEAALMAAAPDAAAGAAAVTRARRVRVLGEDELCEWLEERAREAVEAAGPGDARYGDKERRYMVGDTHTHTHTHITHTRKHTDTHR